MARHLAAIGCPADRIRLARIAVNLEQFPFKPRVPSTELVFIQAARFVKKKGVDLSLRAFAHADGASRGWRLILIGDGPERKPLEALAAQLGIRSSVQFLGMLSHDEYRNAVDQAHVALQPSRTAPNGDTEGGAPTVLLEMQAAGLPVLASQHADIPFVVESGDLTPEDDAEALARAMINLSRLPPRDWDARINRARAFVAEHHDASRVAAQLERIYDEARGLAQSENRRVALSRS